MYDEELSDEIEKGNTAAKELVEHLEFMGADKFGKTIETDNGCYIVEVRKTL